MKGEGAIGRAAARPYPTVASENARRLYLNSAFRALRSKLFGALHLVAYGGRW